jgi:hypothetical protein
MRTLITAGVLAAAVLGNSGCYVASLYPFYTSEDVIFDAGLLGTWVGEEDDVWTISRAKGQPDAYTFEIPDDTSFIISPSSPKVMSAFTVRLFRLDDMLFMDAFPAPSATCDNGFSWSALQAGMHVVFRVWLDGDTLRLQELDPDKVDAGPGARPHPPGP